MSDSYMKQSLQLKIGQQLTMTPQLQQAIRLLQLSTLDLQQEIQKTVESNPMLDFGNGNETQEINKKEQDRLDDSPQTKNQEANKTESSDDFSKPVDEYCAQPTPIESPVDGHWEELEKNPSTPMSFSDELTNFEAYIPNSDSIQDHLHWQLNLTPMSDTDRIIAITLIDSVDDDGYLKGSLEPMTEHLNQMLQKDNPSGDTLIELDEIEAVLHRLQHFDPIGVCARNLSECLLLQLQQLNEKTPLLNKAKEIAREFLTELAGRDFNVIMRRTRLKEADLQQVITLIQSLNPRPGDILSNGTSQYVIPDLSTKKINGQWSVILNNDAMPQVTINSTYVAMIRRGDKSNDNTYLQNQLQEARWFLKSLQNRNDTLLKVATRIVDIQQGFLEHGEEAMKPLVLQDVAEAVEMHESTISRVTTQKFIHTPRGIFELKYFFSSQVDNQSGNGYSSTAIRAIIKKLISAEQPTKPLSDNKIASILAEQGIKIARRTIAKYRESLAIPASNERKRLA
jgi:RNA polymerase sigma-54 factor